MRLIDIDEIGVMPIDSTDLPYDRCLLTYLKEDIDNAPTIKAIPIEKLEQIREEIDKLPKYIAKFTDCTQIHICKDNVLEIIDKAIKEVSK